MKVRSSHININHIAQAGSRDARIEQILQTQFGFSEQFDN